MSNVTQKIRKLEREIEHKINTYSSYGDDIISKIEDRETDIDLENSSWREEEIEILIKELSDLNSILANESKDNTTLSHHAGKLKHFSTNFKRSQSNIRNQYERFQLLSGKKSAPSDSTSINMETLMRERDSIHSASSMTQQLIDDAEVARENMYSQNRSNQNAATKLKGFTGTFSSMSTLMSRIQRKKYRNTLILAGFTATCIILIFLYWANT